MRKLSYSFFLNALWKSVKIPTQFPVESREFAWLWLKHLKIVASHYKWKSKRENRKLMKFFSFHVGAFWQMVLDKPEQISHSKGCCWIKACNLINEQGIIAPFNTHSSFSPKMELCCIFDFFFIKRKAIISPAQLWIFWFQKDHGRKVSEGQSSLSAVCPGNLSLEPQAFLPAAQQCRLLREQTGSAKKQQMQTQNTARKRSKT